MAMKRCPVCGEKYSDTYRNCPFCEEEDALREEEELGRSAGRGRRSARSRQFNLITPTLIVLIIIMASLLVYLLYGDQLGEKLDGGGKDGAAEPPISDTVDPQKPEVTPPVSGGTDTGDGASGSGEDGEGGGTTTPGVIPENPSTTTPANPTSPGTTNSGEMTYERAMALPGGGLSLNKSDFTRSVTEGDYQLKETSGAGKLTWISEDPGVASVDATGKVTPISAGKVNIVVTDGSKKAVCIVRVRGGSTSTSAPAAAPATGGSTSTGSGGASTLNREDMTISAGETFRLRLSGVTTDVTWSVRDSGVATVSGDGTVTGVSKGTTTVTASWDGQSRNCIVRVK